MLPALKSANQSRQVRALLSRALSRILAHFHVLSRILAHPDFDHTLRAHAEWAQRNRQGNQRCPMELLGSKMPNKVWDQVISKLLSRRQKPKRVVIPS